MSGYCSSVEGLKDTLAEHFKEMSNVVLTTRFQKLHDGPNSDVLKRGIGAAQESMEILVHASFWLFPYIVECRIVIRSRAAI